MIKSIQYRNFKALVDTTLPLDWFTLIVGPNGSGKSTAIQALLAVANPSTRVFEQIVTAGLTGGEGSSVDVIVNWGGEYDGFSTTAQWWPGRRCAGPTHQAMSPISGPQLQSVFDALSNTLGRLRVYSLDAQAVARATYLQPFMELGCDGSRLAGVLDALRDGSPERFEELNSEFGRWLPEFDRILFDTPADGQRSIVLRTREGHNMIAASELSQGTLLALAMLALAYIPGPPPIICVEEPDRGIHPRLLRDVHDALYRLSYPESFGEKRGRVQVIATTHSPYFLDLYKDHPEEVVIANKLGAEVRFERLSDRPDLDDILEDTRLGEVWYTGILGGVPTHQ